MLFESMLLCGRLKTQEIALLFEESRRNSSSDTTAYAVLDHHCEEDAPGEREQQRGQWGRTGEEGFMTAREIERAGLVRDPRCPDL